MTNSDRSSTSSDPGSGTSFKVAMSIVLTIGAAEIVAVIWGLATRKREAHELAPSITEFPTATPTLVETRSHDHLVVPPPLFSESTLDLPQEIPDLDPPRSTISPARELSTASMNPSGQLLLPESRQINDPIILESIADGIRLRKEGDAQGALTRFRNADEILGPHPVILAELGRTYEVMGLNKKAIECWESVYRMGESGAGDYYVIADVRLRGLDPEVGGETGSRMLRFGRVVQEETDTPAPELDADESILLRIPIVRNGEGTIAASEVSVYVYFYDQVNDERIEQSTADPPRSSWRTLPIDWESVDPEIFEILYHHPALKPEEIRELGQRRYFGYVLKLYYKDRLQDIIATPRLLLDYAPATTLPQINDILFR